MTAVTKVEVKTGRYGTQKMDVRVSGITELFATLNKRNTEYDGLFSIHLRHCPACTILQTPEPWISIFRIVIPFTR